MNEGQFNLMNPEYKKVEDLGESKMKEVPLLDDEKALSDLDKYLNPGKRKMMIAGGMSNEKFNQLKRQEYDPIVKALPQQDQQELDILMRYANGSKELSNGQALPEMKKLCTNKDVVLLALTHYADSDYQISTMVFDDDTLEFVDEELRLDKDVMVAALKKTPKNIRFYTFSEAVCDNKTLFLSLLQKEGDVLEYASERLQSDNEVVAEAVHDDPRALQYASDTLRGDEDFILRLLTKERSANYYGNFKGYIKEFMSEDLRNDKDFMLKFDTL